MGSNNEWMLGSPASHRLPTPPHTGADVQHSNVHMEISKQKKNVENDH